jgi:antitoxin Phd
MASWPIQDAHDRFEELFEASLREGPQTVTKEGVGAAVLVPLGEWRRLTEKEGPRSQDLKDWLLAPEPRFDLDEILGSERRLRFDPRSVDLAD